MEKYYSFGVDDTYQLHTVSNSPENARDGYSLQTYILLQEKFKSVVFCKLALPFSHRSAFVIFRCGVAQLKIETMRCLNIVLESKI